MARRAIGRTWAENIKSTKISDAKKVNALLWGATATGKTHFLRTVNNVFGLWTEDGTLTLGDVDIPGIFFDADMKIYDTMMSIAKSARQNEGIFEEIEAIAIDSVWKLNQLIMDEILEENNITAPRIQDWGTLRSRMGAIMNQFISMDKHFIGTMGETWKENEQTGLMVPTFNMNGGYASQIDYEFDFLLHFTAEQRGPKTIYKAWTRTKDGYKAKTRVKLPDFFENPSFDQLWDAIQASGKES